MSWARPVEHLGLDDELTAPGVLANPIPVRALFDRAQAQKLVLRNLLQREGHRSVEHIQQEARSEAEQRAQQAERRAQQAERRAQRLEARLRQLGVDLDG